MSDIVENALRAVAAWGLPGARPLPDLDDHTSALVGRAAQARLLGPLLRAHAGGDLPLPDPDLEEALRAHASAQRWCLVVEARYLRARRWFDRAGGIRHLVVKGAAIAHLDEEDPSHRSFADLDLLVDGRDLDAAVEILTARGATRHWAERRPGFDHRFAKSVTMTFPDGVEVDVHRSLCDGAHGFRIPLDDLFAAPDHFALGGISVPTLAPRHRLLHGAYHAALGSPTPRLMNLRDLARYLLRPELGPEVVLPEVRRWRGEAVLAQAIRAVSTTLAVDVPPWTAWLAEADISPAEARLVERQRREGSKLGAGKLLALRELPWPRRPAYALALAVPSRAHLVSRGLRRRDLLGRSTAQLRATRR